MKQILKLTGMAALAAALSTSLTSCEWLFEDDNPVESSPVAPTPTTPTTPTSGVTSVTDDGTGITWQEGGLNSDDR